MCAASALLFNGKYKIKYSHEKGNNLCLKTIITSSKNDNDDI